MPIHKADGVWWYRKYEIGRTKHGKRTDLTADGGWHTLAARCTVFSETIDGGGGLYEEVSDRIIGDWFICL